jgi:hypothetical protein
LSVPQATRDWFALGEELLDRIEGWKIDESCAARLNGFTNTGDLVNCDLAHDDDVAGRQAVEARQRDCGARRQ